MKSCTSCGSAIADEAVYCQSCGCRFAPPTQLNPVLAQTSGKATASLVLGIFFFVLPAAVLAIVFGHISRGEIKRSGGRLTGAGRALAGLILGYIGAAGLPLILIVAAIAIPNLLRARMAANQASAVGSLRTISVAAATYASMHAGYPHSLADLGRQTGDVEPGSGGLIGANLASGRNHGYLFSYQATQFDPQGRVTGFAVRADPAVPGSTGQSHYFVDQTSVIRYDTAKPASEDSIPVE